MGVEYSRNSSIEEKKLRLNGPCKFARGEWVRVVAGKSGVHFMQLGRWCRGEGVVGGGWLVGGLAGGSRSDVSALRARGESRYANTRQRSASGGKRAENESRIPEEIHKGMVRVGRREGGRSEVGDRGDRERGCWIVQLSIRWPATTAFRFPPSFYTTPPPHPSIPAIPLLS